jgi:hypothetical protein
MKTISPAQLEKMLINEVKGSTFMQLIYKGVQKVRKTGNPFGEIIKRTELNVSFFGSYQNAVNNRLKKAGLEADFTANPLPWGEWFVANKIIGHKGAKYVRFYLHKNSNTKTEYFHNGDQLTGSELANAKLFFTEHSESNRQSEAGLEESEQSKPFTINIENILQINVNGEMYKVL